MNKLLTYLKINKIPKILSPNNLFSSVQGFHIIAYKIVNVYKIMELSLNKVFINWSESCSNIYIGKTINIKKWYKQHIAAIGSTQEIKFPTSYIRYVHSFNIIDKIMKILKNAIKVVIRQHEKTCLLKEKHESQKLINEEVKFETEITYSALLN